MSFLDKVEAKRKNKRRIRRQRVDGGAGVVKARGGACDAIAWADCACLMLPLVQSLYCAVG